MSQNVSRARRHSGSEKFAEKARINEKDFTRQRALPLPLLVTLLLNLRKGSNQDELARFFEILADQLLVDGITPSALCHDSTKRQEHFAM